MLQKTLNKIRPIYHFSLAVCSAIIYRYPSRKIHVIGVTGTKGKSSTVEILNSILQEAGYKTAVSNTIRFKIGDDSEPNLEKMSMPGRFFLQSFLRRAVNEKCDYAIVEMTSQGALNYRHLFIDMDMLMFLNISPEHIEAHGSFENYLASKLELAKQLERSSKPNKTMIVNMDDKESRHFLECNADRKITYGIHNAIPYEVKTEGLDFTFDGHRMYSPFSGLFNLYNIIAAATAAKAIGVPTDTIGKAIEKFSHIPGRVDKIKTGQPFTVVVDYAHTPDSLEKFYKVFEKTKNATNTNDTNDSKNICVLGGTGGGRDAWKRSEMGRLADTYCHEIILTDEDPYDEDPIAIVEDVTKGITNHKPQIIMDRRLAIRTALQLAKPGDAVLITGKGTDPFIMGPRGSRIPWSDAGVVREELKKLKV